VVFLSRLSWRASLVCLMGWLLAGQALADAYPSKPLTLIVPFAPGASADGIARLVGKELAQALGQPVVVENKAGAGGALGLIAVAKSAPDGYTLGLGATGAIAVNPHLPDAPPLNPQKDLQPLIKLADIPLVFVASTASGFGNLQSVLREARRNPAGVSCANSGQYTSQHLAAELLANLSQSRLVAVPYRGSGPAVTDVLGGNVPTAMVDLTSAYPHIKTGKLVALGLTSAQRSKVAPDIPTLAEEGVTGYAAPAWMGLFLPAKTPPEVRARLSTALASIMASPGVQAQITALAAEPAYLDGPQFARFIADESKKWSSVIARLSSAK
jgi:tripartite-type tricarboxylate transporter receptor subunit TctC